MHCVCFERWASELRRDSEWIMKYTLSECWVCAFNPDLICASIPAPPFFIDFHCELQTSPGVHIVIQRSGWLEVADSWRLQKSVLLQTPGGKWGNTCVRLITWWTDGKMLLEKFSCRQLFSFPKMISAPDCRNPWASPSCRKLMDFSDQLKLLQMLPGAETLVHSLVSDCVTRNWPQHIETQCVIAWAACDVWTDGLSSGVQPLRE